jgi:hypothetical protein
VQGDDEEGGVLPQHLFVPFMTGDLVAGRAAAFAAQSTG